MKFQAMDVKTGCCREATSIEASAFLHFNSGVNHAFWKSLDYQGFLIDEDTGPGGSHIPGRFIKDEVK